MLLKLNISDRGKSWKIETEDPSIVGKSISDKIDGKLLKSELEGYKFEITGGSDFAGFPMSKDIEGIGLKKVLLTKGWGFSTKTKTGRLPKGIRKRKTVRGKTISESTVQINLKVVKEGSKKLEDIFPEQNKPKEAPKQEVKAEAAEEKAEPQKEEPKKEASKEE